jgi:iron complex outermembrane receptor protein
MDFKNNLGRGFMEKWLGIICGVAMLLVANAGVAAEQSELELDSITVTAQKQEEDVRDVPTSITVVGQEEITDKNIQSLGAMADYVPNFTLFFDGASGMNSPTVRGIHAPVESLTVSTGLNIDGVPVLSATGFENALVDVERVEVLRGPQGTLYGKNTEAGAINIITRKPDNDYRAKLSAEVARLLSAEAGDQLKDVFTLSASGPVLKDRLFLGLAGKFFEKDGFVENTLTGDPVDDKEHWYGRAHLRWTPTDRLDISLIASMLRYDDDAPSMSLAELGAGRFRLPPFEDRKVSPNLRDGNRAREETQALKIEYGITDAMTLTSVTSRREYQDRSVVDWDCSPMTLMHGDKDNTYTKISQELRLDSSSDKLKWLVGLYYDHDHNEVDMVTSSIVPGMASTKSRDFRGESYAVFGQLDYALTSKLHLIGGLRYELQEQEYEDNIADSRTDETWDEFAPKVALEYHFTPEWMAYASISKGYRSGGFNIVSTDSRFLTYDEEKLWSYELGWKSLFWNNRLQLNGAVFYMDITDMQVNEAVSPMESHLTNAAEASAIGVELEVAARVYRGLTLSAGFGYTDLEFDKFEDALGDYSGNRNPYAPEYTFNLGAQYRSARGIYARVDLIGCGKMYFDKGNDYSRSAYEVVNAKLGYETEHVDIYLYGKNIFDEEYDSNGYYDGFYVIYSDPGEVGLQVTCRF